MTVAISSATVISTGCGLNTGGGEIICPDGGPPENEPICGTGGGPGINPQTNPNTCAGKCVARPPADFRESPVLMWIGEDGEQPECPEHAPIDFYSGLEGLNVDLQCQKCTCSPAACILPNGISVHSDNGCAGIGTVYEASAPWDGSCASPAVMAAGTFRSIALEPATVAACTPSAPPKIPPPSLRAEPSSFAGGIYWEHAAKACDGTAEGSCANAGEICIPDTDPTPPQFRHCIQYLPAVKEDALPQCPADYPERFLFHKPVEGKVECSPCECGEPANAQCSVSISAYQEQSCSGNPLFKEFPVYNNASCTDFGAAWLPLGSIEAHWIENKPGECEPKGGEMIGPIKPMEPRVYCCQQPVP